MSEKVHYEDNLYYLHSEMNVIHNGLKLSIDSDFFAARMIDQIFAVDEVLSRHYTLLKENPYLIRRNDYLYSIQKLKNQFSRVVEAISDKKDFFSEKEELRFPELKRKMASHLEDVQTIRKEISDNIERRDDDDSSLSSNEYELLMNPGEDFL